MKTKFWLTKRTENGWKFVAKHFCSIFRLEGGISKHKGSMEGDFMFQGHAQIGKLPLKPRRDRAIFQF